MKITMITGSPHEGGTSALLAERFAEGAHEAEHELLRFDAAFEDIHPCRGCDACGIGARPCVQHDAMDTLYPYLEQADLIALVTPLYYFGMSAQLKTVVDRFYGANSRISGGGRKTVLLATSWNSGRGTMDDLVSHYRTLVDYMGWSDVGMVLGTGCGTRSMAESSPWPERAYLLGKSL